MSRRSNNGPGGRERSQARVVNGVVSAALVAFFAVHGLLGGVSGLVDIPHALAWVSWCGLALVAVHIGLCVATSWQQLTDMQRPPSARKKRHLLLKWISGGVVVAALAAHVALAVAGAGQVRAAVTAVLAAALAVHMCYGAKSLTRDLELNAELRMPFRIAVCTLAGVFALMVLLAAFG